MSAPVPSPVLVIGGMHRSGTSLVASLCHGAGLYLGHRLLGAAHGNVAGHFEDLEFVELHERILVANGLGSEGFAASSLPEVPPRLADEAAALVAARRGLAAPWGWKDPRTILLLDFWARLVPESRFLFVVRAPWDVVDSLFRRGDPAFVHNPPLAPAVCDFYHRQILAFAARHPHRCVVRELAQVVADPAAVFADVRRVGVPLGDPPRDRYRDDLLGAPAAAELARVLRHVCPAALATYADLRAMCGGTSAPLLPAAERVDSASVLIHEWARTAAATRQTREAARRGAMAEQRAIELEQRASELEQRAADVERLLVAATSDRDRVQGEAQSLAAQLEDRTVRLATARAEIDALRARVAGWEATATEIQAALAALDRHRGDTDLAGLFAQRWPSAA